ncbi:MAG: hypothetical protein LC800_22465 [Acidobacteria bacterium]|nr:hypothetical protein [Acidobacteriota bacterium]
MPPIDPSNPLGLLFVASFAVQQILEAVSWPVQHFLGESWKKTALGVVGFLIGLFLSVQLDLYILNYFIPDGVATSALRGGTLDTVLSALVLSAGTEGTNSVLKYLKYLKEDRKTKAAEKVSELGQPAAPAGGGPAPEPVAAPTGGAGASALSYINNK